MTVRPGTEHELSISNTRPIRCRSIGQPRCYVKVFMFPLFLERSIYFSPCGDETSRRNRQVPLDLLSQFREIVVWDCGVHMVFEMIVHIPIEESRYRPTDICPRTLPPIGDVRTQHQMLRHVSSELVPHRDERAKRYEYDEIPIPGDDKESRKRCMTENE